MHCHLFTQHDFRICNAAKGVQDLPHTPAHLLEDLPSCKFIIFAVSSLVPWAGYYSYKFAEVLSADAFSAFEEAGLDDDSKVQETGHRFRDTVLALGGGRAPDLVFKVRTLDSS